MIESLTALWFFAFFIDTLLGCLSFYMVLSKLVTVRYEALCWYMGWWSFADAIALMLNGIMGTDYFWSYHQSGIISDTAINIGLIVYVSRVIYDNWAMTDADWVKIDEIRRQSKIRALSNGSK